MAKVIQVRDVPDDLHELLTREADELGTSLNRLVLAELERVGRRRRNAELFRQAQQEPWPDVTTQQIVDDIREMRGPLP